MSGALTTKKVRATAFRSNYRALAQTTRGRRVLLIENRRQKAKYLVDKEFLDTLLRERESILATMEIMADRELFERLLELGKTVDDDFRSGRLKTYSLDEVLGGS